MVFYHLKILRFTKKDFSLRNVCQNCKYMGYVSVVKERNPRVVIATKTKEKFLGNYLSGFVIQIENVEILT